MQKQSRTDTLPSKLQILAGRNKADMASDHLLIATTMKPAARERS